MCRIHQVGDNARSGAGDAGIAEPAPCGHTLNHSSRVVNAAVGAGPLWQILGLPPPGLIILKVQLQTIQQQSAWCLGELQASEVCNGFAAHVHRKASLGGRTIASGGS